MGDDYEAHKAATKAAYGMAAHIMARNLDAEERDIFDAMINAYLVTIMARGYGVGKEGPGLSLQKTLWPPEPATP